MDVSFREVSRANVHDVLALAVAPEQIGYVASNAKSIAEAHFEPKAWFRAIAAGEELVGFVMVYRDPSVKEFYLWRFMIDAGQQGRGFGRRAMELLLDEARGDGAEAVTLSVVPGEHSARAFYARLGFAETGELDGHEVVMRLQLSES